MNTSTALRELRRLIKTSNLQWLLAQQNCSKRANCSISKEDLLTEYLNYENKINKKT